MPKPASKLKVSSGTQARPPRAAQATPSVGPERRPPAAAPVRAAAASAPGRAVPLRPRDAVAAGRDAQAHAQGGRAARLDSPTPTPAPPRAEALSPLARQLGKRRPFDTPEQEAYLNLVRTTTELSASFERLFKRHGLSEATYNVLRILRGEALAAGAPGHASGADHARNPAESAPSHDRPAAGRACHEIARRMVAGVPDVTRLVDRLERAGLARRARLSTDRRVVLVQITPAGLERLERLDAPVLARHREQLGHLSAAELDTLNALLVKARAAAQTPESDA